MKRAERGGLGETARSFFGWRASVDSSLEGLIVSCIQGNLV